MVAKPKLHSYIAWSPKDPGFLVAKPGVAKPRVHIIGLLCFSRDCVDDCPEDVWRFDELFEDV